MIKPIFFVAEISANHCGKLHMAKKLILCAKKNGANAVKLQTYTADTMTLDSKKNILELLKVYGKVTIYGIFTTKQRLR